MLAVETAPMAGQRQINTRKGSRGQERRFSDPGDDFFRFPDIAEVEMTIGGKVTLIKLLLLGVDVVRIDARPSRRGKPFSDEANSREEFAERLALG